MRIITTTDDLARFSAELKERPHFAVDTEFMREKTYWPILCLIQAAAEGTEAIIDPMAPGIDLSPFLDALRDRSTTKVFHAARQDVEIFFQLTGEAPAPLFDTQIAAMACGFGDQIGYEPLMRSLLNASIDKGSRFTDWSRRPLSAAQLQYALSDVTHLRDAYLLLRDRLEEEARLSWVEAEMEALRDPALYRVDPKTAWSRLKLRGVRPNDVGPIVKLAEWREKEAQEKNLPRGRILKDEAIFELARLKPATQAELASARTMPNGFERSKSAIGILEAVAAGRAVPRAELPELEKPSRRAPPPPDVVELLKVLLKRQSEASGVASRLIASSQDLEDIAVGEKDVAALQGWRRDVFGEMAERLLAGKVALRLKNGAIDLVDSER
ncbi:MAG: ribonuclease D [Alphaproteobacteria bacterium RIFCSPHIGHO2_12_FULL_63_12]|nr:MAG: ribonuclease D [Alphaproteobacteria bacterium RIFCSPHIGHO2_12_FULL_63_12]